MKVELNKDVILYEVSILIEEGFFSKNPYKEKMKKALKIKKEKERDIKAKEKVASKLGPTTVVGDAFRAIKTAREKAKDFNLLSTENKKISLDDVSLF